jgi:hypothetical protein
VPRRNWIWSSSPPARESGRRSGHIFTLTATFTDGADTSKRQSIASVDQIEIGVCTKDEVRERYDAKED